MTDKKRSHGILAKIIDHTKFSLNDAVWNETGDEARLVSCSEMGSLVVERVKAD